MDATEFKRASQAVWEAMAPGWDRRHSYLETSARPVAERMLERLHPAPGETILEIAAGTGVVGFAASALVKPGGRVILSDFSDAMVEVARRRASELAFDNVECRRLDAEHLDLGDGEIDGVLCRWGYMLMAHPSLALAETRRVLRAGGRLSCAVFAGPAENPWAALPAQVLQERGHMAPPEAGAPGILALGDRGRLSGLVEAAGFSSPQIDDVPFTWTFSDFDDYWDFLEGAAGAIAMVLNQLSEDERRSVRDEIVTRVDEFSRKDGLEFPAMSLVAAAS